MSKGNRTKKEMLDEVLKEPLSQNPINHEDLSTYLRFVLTNQEVSDEDSEVIRDVEQRLATVSDVTIIINAIVNQMEQQTTSMMSTIQVQQKVLEKLGATEDMFKEAKEEYNQSIKELEEKLKSQREQEEDDEDNKGSDK